MVPIRHHLLALLANQLTINSFLLKSVVIHFGSFLFEATSSVYLNMLFALQIPFDNFPICIPKGINNAPILADIFYLVDFFL